MKLIKKITVLLAGLLLMGTICSCGAADSFAPKGYKLISAEKVGYRLYVPDDWITDLSTGVATAYVSEKDRSNVSFMAFEVDDTIIQATVGGGNGGESDSGDTKDAVTGQEDTVADTLSSGTSESAAMSGSDDTSESAAMSGSDDTSESAAVSDSADTAPEIGTVEEYWEYYSADFLKTFPDMEYTVNGENMLLSGKAAKKYVYTATVTGKKYTFMQVVMLNAGTVYIFTYTALPDKYEEHLKKIEEMLGYIDIGS